MKKLDVYVKGGLLGCFVLGFDRLDRAWAMRVDDDWRVGSKVL